MPDALEQSQQRGTPLLPAATRQTAASPSEIAELDDDIARLTRGDWREADMKRQYSTMRTVHRDRKSRYDEPNDQQ
jgi:hypothetical protein